jgi:hypothetical protein
MASVANLRAKMIKHQKSNSFSKEIGDREIRIPFGPTGVVYNYTLLPATWNQYLALFPKKNFEMLPWSTY